MSDGALVTFGTAIFFLSVAACYVAMRERFLHTGGHLVEDPKREPTAETRERSAAR